MKNSIYSRLAVLLAMALPALSAQAQLTVSTAANAAPAGVHYVNFDDMTYADPTSGGIAVTFTPNSGMNIGAAPYLTNGNGARFGDPTPSGPDQTPFVFSGSPVTLTMPGEEHYFGLLWGSVDAINSVSFYAADHTLVGRITGGEVAPDANGSWGADGTVYVNVGSAQAFTTVVVDSGGGIFEFDNVAYDANVPSFAPVPESSEAAMLVAGLAAVGWASRRRRAR